MGDPYRTGGGTPCPRCKKPLLYDEGGEQRCTEGCGTWLPSSILATLLDVATLPTISRGNPFRATALPTTRCLVCRAAMNDIYQGPVDTLVVGQCVAHGIWIENADRATFERMYAAEISASGNKRSRVAALEAARGAEQSARIHGDPIVAELLRRVADLEARVADLEQNKPE